MINESRFLYIALIILSIVFSILIRYSEYNRGKAEGELLKSKELLRIYMPARAEYSQPDTTDGWTN